MSATDYRNHFVDQYCYITCLTQYCGKPTKVKVSEKFVAVSLLACGINVVATKFQKTKFCVGIQMISVLTSAKDVI